MQPVEQLNATPVHSKHLSSVTLNNIDLNIEYTQFHHIFVGVDREPVGHLNFTIK